MTPRKFLIRVLLSAKRLTVPAIILVTLWQVGEALVPVIAGAAIDTALSTGDFALLLFWLAVLAADFVMLSLGYRFGIQLCEKASRIAQHRLQATISRVVLHPREVREAPEGSVVSTATNDVRRLAMLTLGVFPLGEFAGAAFITVSLFVIDWRLGLAVVIGAPLTLWLMGLLSGRYAKANREYQTLLASTVGRATDLVTGYRVVRGIGAEAEAARRYRESSATTLKGAFGAVGALGRYLFGSNTVAGVFSAGLAMFAAWLATEQQISVGGLIAAVGLAQALLVPLSMLAGNAVPGWAAAKASSARVLELLTEQPRTAAVTPDVDVAVGEGELVGARAADTTAAGVIAKRLRERDPGDARTVIAPHEGVLFSGSVGDNVSNEKGKRAEALTAAACDEFLASMGGVDAEIGEMGARLSGGQRQRLALARALATDADTLVLHDPTTAVDSVTEQLIATGLRGIRQGKSTLLITSSPALLGVCDRVVDLRSGGDENEVAK